MIGKGRLNRLEFASLGSGSKGNCTVVRSGDTCVLIDCGFSVTETTKRLTRLNLTPEHITAVLLTHEHSDHSNGVAAVCRRFNVPLYTSWGTLASLQDRGAKLEGVEVQRIASDSLFELGELMIQAVLVPHDSREPLQFALSNGASKLGVLTDLGSVTPHVVLHYKNCDALLLEFNHDEQMLREGPYPARLKSRVAGNWGHLSNVQAAHLLADLDHEALQFLVIAHISEQNNNIALVQDILRQTLISQIDAVFAEQATGFGWLTVQAESVDMMAC